MIAIGYCHGVEIDAATGGLTGTWPNGGSVITLDYAELGDLQGRMRAIYQDIETNLSDLKQQVETVSQIWTGSASDGFRDSVRSWLQSAADLQDRLAELHNFVGRAHDNQASAVASNTRIWSAGTGR